MAARISSQASAGLDLPPLFQLVTVRETGNALEHAVKIADQGAGTLVWARRFQLAECAVVLEPTETLANARLVFYACMNALADCLAIHCPPEKSVQFEWPDTVLLDGGLLGGGRLAWNPGVAENDTPEWLVFGATLRTAGHYKSEPGERKRGVALEEEGIWDVGPAQIVESFARHLMLALHNWTEFGPRREIERWLERFPRPKGSLIYLDDEGNLCSGTGAKIEKRPLLDALAAPSWLDTQTGEPWL